MRLRDLIRSVRQCKTAAEERDVIAKEAAALRQAFKEQDGTHRHSNVAKLMYMHMLGYPTHFGQMETLKLIASSGFPEKRIGYLGLMILLDERQEVLMLVTNSLKNDLASRSQYTCGLALCALGNIASAGMARDLAPEVERLLASPSAHVRKKAALCARRVLRRAPDAIERFVDAAAALLGDRSHAVVLAGAALALDIVAAAPATAAVFRDAVPALCRTLRALQAGGGGGGGAEYDAGGVCDPYLQVALLRLLRALGAGAPDASDAMADALAQVAANTDGARNAGAAVLYEAARTILAVEATGGLRVLAVNILARFLGHRDNNARAVALAALRGAVAAEPGAVARHRGTVAELVRDGDASVRGRALELARALATTPAAAAALVRELLDFLPDADPEFHADLAAAVCRLAAAPAADPRWRLDALVELLAGPAGGHVQPEPVRALLGMVQARPELQAYAARKFYAALAAAAAGPGAGAAGAADRADGGEPAPALLAAAAWVVGEYADLLVDEAAASLPGEELAPPPGGADVAAALAAVAARRGAGARPAREAALTALAKAAARLPAAAPAARAALEARAADAEPEAQTRAVEYARLFKYEAIRPAVLDRIPPREGDAGGGAAGEGELLGEGGAAGGAPPGGDAAADLAALLGLDVGGGDVGGGAPPAAAAPAASLAELLGGDLGGGGLGSGGAAPAAADPLAELFGGGGGAPAPPPAAAAPVALVAFSRDGLTVTLSASKPPGGDGSATDIVATAVNDGDEPVAAFALQAAVPKYMTLRLEPASGGALPPRGGRVTQAMRVVNAQHGARPVALRLRLGWDAGGARRTEQCTVDGFPPGW